jgi:hypothetical protein
LAEKKVAHTNHFGKASRATTLRVGRRREPTPVSKRPFETRIFYGTRRHLRPSAVSQATSRFLADKRTAENSGASLHSLWLEIDAVAGSLRPRSARVRRQLAVNLLGDRDARASQLYEGPHRLAHHVTDDPSGP